MHWRFAKRFVSAALFTTVNAVVDVSRGDANTSSLSDGGGFAFASAHPASQARQPTHRVVSTSIPAPSAPPSPAAPPAVAAADPAAAAPAPTAATFMNPLRPIFIFDSPCFPVRRGRR